MKRQNVRTLSLIVVTFTYLLLGAAIFDALESEFEISEDVRLKENAEILRIKYNITIDDFEKITQLGIQMKPYKAGTQWKFAGAFYFSTTVITTIGYGHSTPKTFGGKIFCMCYALPGIPLCLIMFQSIGERMNTIITYLLKKSNLMCKIHKLISQTHLMIVSFTIGSIVLTIGAIVFSRYEDWDYLDSFYYCFITLTTIGFGDFVALQRNNSLAKRPDYVAFSLIFILFGLTVVSSVMNLLVLRFLTMNTEDEKRDQLEAAVHAQELQRLRGDVICADKQNELQTSLLTQQLQGDDYERKQLNNYHNYNHSTYQQNINHNLINCNHIMSLSNSNCFIKTSPPPSSSSSSSTTTTTTTTTTIAMTSTVNNCLLINRHTDTYHMNSKNENLTKFKFCLICLKKFHPLSQSLVSLSSPGILNSSLTTVNDNSHENMLNKPISTNKTTATTSITYINDNNNNNNNSNNNNNNPFLINCVTGCQNEQSTTRHPILIYDEISQNVSSNLHQDNCSSELLNSSNSLQYDLCCRNRYIYPDYINSYRYNPYHSFHGSKYSPLIIERCSVDNCNCTNEKLRNHQYFISPKEYLVDNRQPEIIEGNETIESDNLSENKSSSFNDIDLIQSHFHLMSSFKPHTYDFNSPGHFSLPGRHKNTNEVMSTPVHSSLVAHVLKSHKHNFNNQYILPPRQSLNSQPPLSSGGETIHPLLSLSTHHHMDVLKSNQPLINPFPLEFLNSRSNENEIVLNSVPYFQCKRYPRVHQEQQMRMNEMNDYGEESVDFDKEYSNKRPNAHYYHDDILLTNDVSSIDDEIKFSADSSIFEVGQPVSTKRSASV
ncbi:potassium channel subfamily K member 9 [Schistosoma bovis]|uniref:Potassium channel subfamily K member 9 n=1 Tax=Schistosoma bovis TaxID=6184 RepID=A0A430QR46_SCHBO|nr:potassium channel subfamily K member 9 [Schistosoma bovis]